MERPRFFIPNVGPKVVTEIFTHDRYSTHTGTNIPTLKVTGTCKGRAAQPEGLQGERPSQKTASSHMELSWFYPLRIPRTVPKIFPEPTQA